MKPLFNALGGGQMPGALGNFQQMMQQFQQFRATFQGDPEQEVRKLIASGKISQNQLNQLQQAALITVREYLSTRSAPKVDAQSVQESADDKKRRDAVVLMTHSADLDTVPTIQQVETALQSISVNTPEERKRVQDAKKWAQIISQKNA